MRSTLALAVAALGSTISTALACLEYSHNLQASYFGLNDLFYTLKDNGDIKCEGHKQTSSDFGQSQFDVECDSGWGFHLDVDEGTYGAVHIHANDGRTFDLPLNKDGFDHQFGCGSTVCIGVEEDRSTRAYC